MKKVTGYVDVKPFGCYDFEFYVDENATVEDIREKIDESIEINMHYHIEEGYTKYTEINYQKRD